MPYSQKVTRAVMLEALAELEELLDFDNRCSERRPYLLEIRNRLVNVQERIPAMRLWFEARNDVQKQAQLDILDHRYDLLSRNVKAIDTKLEAQKNFRVDLVRQMQLKICHIRGRLCARKRSVKPVLARGEDILSTVGIVSEDQIVMLEQECKNLDILCAAESKKHIENQSNTRNSSREIKGLTDKSIRLQNEQTGLKWRITGLEAQYSRNELLIHELQNTLTQITAEKMHVADELRLRRVTCDNEGNLLKSKDIHTIEHGNINEIHSERYDWSHNTTITRHQRAKGHIHSYQDGEVDNERLGNEIQIDPQAESTQKVVRWQAAVPRFPMGCAEPPEPGSRSGAVIRF